MAHVTCVVSLHERSLAAALDRHRCSCYSRLRDSLRRTREAHERPGAAALVPRPRDARAAVLRRLEAQEDGEHAKGEKGRPEEREVAVAVSEDVLRAHVVLHGSGIHKGHKSSKRLSPLPNMFCTRARRQLALRWPLAMPGGDWPHERASSRQR